MRALRGEVEAGAGPEPETHDVRMRALDGREVEVTLSTAPLRDREGQLVGVVSVLHDQTERNRLERERAAARADELAAREASRQLEEFLATAAHDLRTPLSTTIGFLDLAERASERLASTVRKECPALAPQVEAVREREEDADQSAERLSRLLSLLFDTAALHAGKLELHRCAWRRPAALSACIHQQPAGSSRSRPTPIASGRWSRTT